jgi:hypothetical protein
VRRIRVTESSRDCCNGQAASRQCFDRLPSATFAEQAAKDQLLFGETALKCTDIHGQSVCDIRNHRDPTPACQEIVNLAAHQQADVGPRR